MHNINPKIEHLAQPIGQFTHYDGNARRHNLQLIASSLKANSQYRTIVVRRHETDPNRDNVVLAGNGTLEAARDLLGWTHIAAEYVECDDLQARRIVLVDNKANDEASYDDTALAELLAGLQGDFEGTGFEESDLDALLEELAGGGDDDSEREASTGELLSLVDVTMGEPKTEVHAGEVWTLGRHTLVIAKLIDGHPLWAPKLGPDVKFCPYPDPYLTLGTLARENTLLLVQPNKFLAGHLIDKHSAAFPDEKVVKL